MELDLRQAGKWRMSGVGPDGEPFTLHGVYLVIDPPTVLEFTWNAANEPQTKVRFELSENEGVTAVRIAHSGFSSEENRNRYKGWPWLLALMRSYVKSKKEKS
jgi:uncharacterized protein YndB with AHSA1/START domain